MRLSAKEENDFSSLIEKYVSDPDLCRMKNYVQHGNVTTFMHCVKVAQTSFVLNRRLHLGVNEEKLVKAAMLHDFYLYDWHEKSDDHRLHGFTHAQKAADNARRYFNIDKEEYFAIRSHMWPLNITRNPISRLGWIVCMADKLCAAKETLFYRS